MDVEIHDWFHQILQDALLTYELPGGFGRNASRVNYQKLFSNPATKELGELALIDAATYLDEQCTGVPGYTPLLPEIEKAIANGWTDF